MSLDELYGVSFLSLASPSAASVQAAEGLRSCLTVAQRLQCINDDCLPVMLYASAV